MNQAVKEVAKSALSSAEKSVGKANEARAVGAKHAELAALLRAQVALQTAAVTMMVAADA